VGFGQQVEGRLTRSNYVITRESEDHEVARQYWTRADGSGREWPTTLPVPEDAAKARLTDRGFRVPESDDIRPWRAT
jgi:hypothetical protein